MIVGDVIGALARVFATVSVLEFGGINTVLPEIRRQTVDTMHWLTDAQFADLYAISQAAPGPTSLIATVIGYRVAGVAGAMVSTIAICGPPALLAYLVARGSARFRGASWRTVIQAGLTPVMAGFMAASALVLIRAADHSLAALAVTVATATLVYATDVNPLWAFALAGALGAAGFL